MDENIMYKSFIVAGKPIILIKKILYTFKNLQTI